MTIDPLSDVTRKQRRWLLGTSLVAIVVGHGVFPQEISAFGLQARDIPNGLFPSIILAVVLYFFLAFALYAAHDFVTRTDRLWEERLQLDAVAASEQGREFLEHRRTYGYSPVRRPIEYARYAFDFLLPLLIGIYGMSAVFFGELAARTYAYWLGVGVAIFVAMVIAGGGLIALASACVRKVRVRQLRKAAHFGAIGREINRLDTDLPFEDRLVAAFLSFRRGKTEGALEQLGRLRQSAKHLEGAEDLVRAIDRAVSSLEVSARPPTGSTATTTGAPTSDETSSGIT